MKVASVSSLLAVALLTLAFESTDALHFVVPKRPFQRALPGSTSSDTARNVASVEPKPADHSSALPELAIWKLALAGAIATIVGDAAVHPIDCIKTLQQSDEGVGLDIAQAVAVLTASGLGGLYRGLSTYLCSDAVGGALKFGTYESLKRASQHKWEGDALIVATYVSAALAFMASSVILVPGEFIKQQLQMGIYPSLQETLTHVLATSGIQGLYAGYDGVLLRDIPYTMIELGLYDQLKALYKKAKPISLDGQSTLSSWEEIAVAGATGSIAGFFTTPLDTIKTKLMVDTELYNDGFWQCWSETIHDHGVESLFAGALARVLWVGPFTAMYLPMYDWTKRAMMADRK
jgi:solute carrier family 25 (mitochondrial S-adenosylmethionine transporter), member 26